MKVINVASARPNFMKVVPLRQGFEGPAPIGIIRLQRLQI